MVTRILVGVDGSGPSRSALRWAARRARETDAPLVLEHVVDDEWGQVGSEYAAEETLAGERILRQALDSTEVAGLTAETRLRHGSPAWSLLGDAEPGDLVVVGSHKTGFLRGRVLGTRSIVVASAAPCSVVVVPEDNSARRRGVLVGVAAGAQSDAAVVAGAVEAERVQEELTLIHAGETDQPEIQRALLAHAAEIASSTAPGLTIRRRLVHRKCTDVLLDSSRTASLLVLGASRVDVGHAGFLGSVAHEVLLNLNSPVMIARPVAG